MMPHRIRQTLIFKSITISIVCLFLANTTFQGISYAKPANYSLATGNLGPGQKTTEEDLEPFVGVVGEGEKKEFVYHGLYNPSPRFVVLEDADGHPVRRSDGRIVFIPPGRTVHLGLVWSPERQTHYSDVRIAFARMLGYELDPATGKPLSRDTGQALSEEKERQFEITFGKYVILHEWGHEVLDRLLNELDPNIPIQHEAHNRLSNTDKEVFANLFAKAGLGLLDKVTSEERKLLDTLTDVCAEPRFSPFSENVTLLLYGLFKEHVLRYDGEGSTDLLAALEQADFEFTVPHMLDLTFSSELSPKTYEPDPEKRKQLHLALGYAIADGRLEAMAVPTGDDEKARLEKWQRALERLRGQLEAAKRQRRPADKQSSVRSNHDQWYGDLRTVLGTNGLDLLGHPRVRGILPDPVGDSALRAFLSSEGLRKRESAGHVTDIYLGRMVRVCTFAAGQVDQRLEALNHLDEQQVAQSMHTITSMAKNCLTADPPQPIDRLEIFGVVEQALKQKATQERIPAKKEAALEKTKAVRAALEDLVLELESEWEDLDLVDPKDEAGTKRKRMRIKEEVDRLAEEHGLDRAEKTVLLAMADPLSENNRGAGSTGTGVLDGGIMPHRDGPGTVHACLQDTLYHCLTETDMIEKSEGRLKEEDEDIAAFRSWYETEGKENPGTDVPDKAKIDITKLAPETIDAIPGSPDSGKLRVARLPVAELGRDKEGKPFCAHVSFREPYFIGGKEDGETVGILWLACDRDEVEVELSIMHEQKHYGRALQVAKLMGRPVNMAELARWRDGEKNTKYSTYGDPVRHFAKDHVLSWYGIMRECIGELRAPDQSVADRAKRKVEVAKKHFRKALEGTNFKKEDIETIMSLLEGYGILKHAPRVVKMIDNHMANTYVPPDIPPEQGIGVTDSKGTASDDINEARAKLNSLAEPVDECVKVLTAIVESADKPTPEIIDTVLSAFSHTHRGVKQLAASTLYKWWSMLGDRTDAARCVIAASKPYDAAVQPFVEKIKAEYVDGELPQVISTKEARPSLRELMVRVSRTHNIGNSERSLINNALMKLRKGLICPIDMTHQIESVSEHHAGLWVRRAIMASCPSLASAGGLRAETELGLIRQLRGLDVDQRPEMLNVLRRLRSSQDVVSCIAGLIASGGMRENPSLLWWLRSYSTGGSSEQRQKAQLLIAGLEASGVIGGRGGGIAEGSTGSLAGIHTGSGSVSEIIRNCLNNRKTLEWMAEQDNIELSARTVDKTRKKLQEDKFTNWNLLSVKRKINLPDKRRLREIHLPIGELGRKTKGDQTTRVFAHLGLRKGNIYIAVGIPSNPRRPQEIALDRLLDTEEYVVVTDPEQVRDMLAEVKDRLLEYEDVLPDGYQEELDPDELGLIREGAVDLDRMSEWRDAVSPGAQLFFHEADRRAAAAAVKKCKSAGNISLSELISADMATEMWGVGTSGEVSLAKLLPGVQRRLEQASEKPEIEYPAPAGGLVLASHSVVKPVSRYHTTSPGNNGIIVDRDVRVEFDRKGGPTADTTVTAPKGKNVKVYAPKAQGAGLEELNNIAGPSEGVDRFQISLAIGQELTIRVQEKLATIRVENLPERPGRGSRVRLALTYPEGMIRDLKEEAEFTRLEHDIEGIRAILGDTLVRYRPEVQELLLRNLAPYQSSVATLEGQQAMKLIFSPMGVSEAHINEMLARLKAAPAGGNPASPSGEVSGKKPKKTVLIVDDNPSWCFRLEKEFKKAGFEVSTAENGIRALDIMMEEKVDVVLTDLDMPRMDGLGLAEALKDTGIPVVLMTVVSIRDTRLRGMRLSERDNENIETVLWKCENPTVAVKKVDEILKARRIGEKIQTVNKEHMAMMKKPAKVTEGRKVVVPEGLFMGEENLEQATSEGIANDIKIGRGKIKDVIDAYAGDENATLLLTAKEAEDYQDKLISTECKAKIIVLDGYDFLHLDGAIALARAIYREDSESAERLWSLIATEERLINSIMNDPVLSVPLYRINIDQASEEYRQLQREALVYLKNA